jgi:hypothetical protein
VGSARAGSGREASTVDGIGVRVSSRPVDWRGSGGGLFDGWRVSAGMLFDAVATASSLLNGAMPSLGTGMADGSWLTPPLLVIVCTDAASLAELEPASTDLLFSMVPTKLNEVQVRSCFRRIRT